MGKRKKMSPEARAEWRAHQVEVDARIRQLRELVARGEAGLHARRGDAPPGVLPERRP